MPTTTKLVWTLRARKEKNWCADRRIWGSRCGCYRVVESRIRYGHLPVVYYAEARRNAGAWDMISKHRTARAAIEACQRHYDERG